MALPHSPEPSELLSLFDALGPLRVERNHGDSPGAFTFVVAGFYTISRGPEVNGVSMYSGSLAVERSPYGVPVVDFSAPVLFGSSRAGVTYHAWCRGEDCLGPGWVRFSSEGIPDKVRRGITTSRFYADYVNARERDPARR